MTQSKKNCEYYFWCCDFYSNTGEGKLAHLFIYYFLKVFKKKIIQIRFNKKNIFISRKILKKNNYFISNKINFNFLFKYVYPFYGIFMLWINFFKNKKIFYINYLPLWNFFIFLLAPPTTNFGPITGAYYKGKIYNLNTIIRKYIFPILYRFSYFLLLTRNKKLFFSNNEFYELFKKKNHIDQVFNFQILYLYNKKIIKRTKELLFIFLIIWASLIINLILLELL